MNRNKAMHDPSPARRRWWSYALGLLALVTCPCHVPLLALALSGTVAGALLTVHFDAALMLFTVAFLLSLCAAIWVWHGQGGCSRQGCTLERKLT
ncbi:MAG: broad-spectrum mercury transporter MerE [Gammaproteobacteria bacterium]